MKKIAILIVLVPLFFISCSNRNYKKLDDGIIVYVKDSLGIHAVKLTIIDEQIIHVQASRGENIASTNSLMTVELPAKEIKWELKDSGPAVLLSTDKLQAGISKKTGEVWFTDKLGNKLLAEKSGGGKEFTEMELEGKTYYSIRQVFDSPVDEAFYGLGQHQHDIMNYKGKDVDLYQHNIVAVIPFLVSNRNGMRGKGPESCTTHTRKWD